MGSESAREDWKHSVKDCVLVLADPGEARGCSSNSFVIDSFIQLPILFLPQLYGAATPKGLEIGLPVIK